MPANQTNRNTVKHTQESLFLGDDVLLAFLLERYRAGLRVGASVRLLPLGRLEHDVAGLFRFVDILWKLAMSKNDKKR